MFEEFTTKKMLESRLSTLWVRIEQADAAGDDYHVALWMRLTERLEAMIARLG